MDQYTKGSIEISLYITVVFIAIYIILRHVKRKNRFKILNNVNITALFIIYGILFLVSNFTTIVKDSNHYFNKHPIFYTILSLMTIISSCVGQLTTPESKDRFKRKINHILDFITTSIIGFPFFSYFQNKIHLFLVLKGFYPISNSVNVLGYVIITGTLSAFLASLIYIIIDSLLKFKTHKNLDNVTDPVLILDNASVHLHDAWMQFRYIFTYIRS